MSLNTPCADRWLPLRLWHSSSATTVWRVLAFLGGIPSVVGVEDVCCLGATRPGFLQV